MKFELCTYGGGHFCKRQGGSGCTFHKAGYVHPFSYTLENIKKAEEGQERTFSAPELEGDIQNEENSEDLLESGNQMNSPGIPQLYYFDLQSLDGVKRLIELLPILDEDIVSEVYQTIWPGYPVDDEEHFNVRVARLELRGYALDYLNTNELTSESKRPRKVPTSYDFKGKEDITEEAQ